MKVGCRLICFSIVLAIILLSFPSYIEALTCTVGGDCSAVYNFTKEIFNVKQPVSTKQCDDACAIWWCLIDGKKVLLGGGCYSDYAKICGSVSNNAQYPMPPKMPSQQDGIVEDAVRGDNAMVYACIYGDDCATKHYHGLHARATDYFRNQFLKGADKTFTKSCLYGPGAPLRFPPKEKPKQNNTKTASNVSPELPNIKTLPQNQSSSGAGLMNQMNGFKFFGMILSGFFLTQFW